MAMKNNALIRGTTPTIKFTFSTLDVGEIEDARLVIKQKGEPVITVGFDSATSDSGYVKWTLSQEDTFKLKEFETAEIFCDWLTYSGLRGRSKMRTADVEPTGYEEVMGATPTDSVEEG